jgi:hypothetical protein
MAGVLPIEMGLRLAEMGLRLADWLPITIVGAQPGKA